MEHTFFFKKLFTLFFRRRQIGFLQERTDTLEKRMQQELEYLETDYETKIEKLKNERIQVEAFYKEEIQNLKVRSFLKY